MIRHYIHGYHALPGRTSQHFDSFGAEETLGSRQSILTCELLNCANDENYVVMITFIK